MVEESSWEFLQKMAGFSQKMAPPQVKVGDVRLLYHTQTAAKFRVTYLDGLHFYDVHMDEVAKATMAGFLSKGVLRFLT